MSHFIHALHNSQVLVKCIEWPVNRPTKIRRPCRLKLDLKLYSQKSRRVALVHLLDLRVYDNLCACPALATNEGLNVNESAELTCIEPNFIFQQDIKSRSGILRRRNRSVPAYQDTHF